MNLNTRINLILLPLIIGIFTAVAWLSNTEDLFYQKHAIEYELEHQLIELKNRLTFDLMLRDSFIQQVDNSNEFIRYMTNSAHYPNVREFQRLLDRLRLFANKSQTTIQSVHLLYSNREILFASEERDIFEEVKIPMVPSEFQWWNKVDSKITTNHRSFIFKDSDQKYQLGTIHIISKTSMAADMRNLQKVANLYMLIISDIDYLTTGIDYMATGYGSGILPEVNIELDYLNHDIETTIETTSDGEDVLGYLRHNMFSLTAIISRTSIQATMERQYFRTALKTIFLISISYFLLLMLINIQIIQPIRKLSKSISTNSGEPLKKFSGNDEVTILNNSYLSLLEDVQHLAKHDPLTKLANRTSFQNYFTRILEKNKRNKEPLGILFIDLDNFKQVNDIYGHNVGDELLIKFSHRLVECTRSTDSLTRFEPSDDVARLAGDEFAVVLSDIVDSKSVARVAQRLIDLFKDGFKVGDDKHNVKASIGIAMFPEDGTTVEELIKHADAAMYQAKAQGRNQFHFFTQSIAESLKLRTNVEKAIESSLRKNKFKLVYMPIFNSKTRTVTGYEVLIRSNNSLLKECGPEVFIPIAESSGFIKQIDYWVINEAFKIHQQITVKYPETYTIAINISGFQLHNSEFVTTLKALMQKHQINPSSVELEVTETALVRHDSQSADIMKEIKDTGVKLSLDDFGTGYTTFNQLIDYPIDKLKIDRSFVSNMNEDSGYDVMLKTMVNLAKLYNLSTVGEGVESESQAAYLQTLGCEYLQGFYLSKPLMKKDFIKLLDSNSLALNNDINHPSYKTSFLQ